MTLVQEDILSDIIEPPKPASISKRIGAALIDSLILALVLMVIANSFGERYDKKTTTTVTVSSTPDSAKPTTTTQTTSSSGYDLSGWPLVVYLASWFLLIPFMEGKTGQTIGKKLLRLKVNRQNGNPTNIGVSLVRHLFDCIEFIFLIGFFIAVSNPQHKRIGDFVAGTVVVDKNP
jgi:uncharacterized RDD family membrane protein YckC